MTRDQATRLRIGDKVKWMWYGEPDDAGIVLKVGDGWVEINWTDGLSGTIDFRDMEAIRLAE